MSLRGWSWDAVAGPAGLGDRPLLEALAAALPDAAVEDAIERTGTRERRRRALPTHLVVALVVAMGLWAEAAVRQVLAEVVAGWREAREHRTDALAAPGGRAAGGRAAGGRPRPPWELPSTAAIVQARRRAGVRLFRELFHAVAGPLAARRTAAGAGAFLRGLRLMAVDGTTLDVADTPANARAFGRPTTRRGAGAFPQLRLVALIETGTHALCDVVLRPFRGGEAPAARHLLRSVGPGMLLLWDRGFHGYELVERTLARGADFLGRAKAKVVLPPETVLPDGSYLSTIYPSPTARRRRAGGLVVRVVEYALDTPAGPGRERYRLLTSLLDPRAFPAAVLAATYHERWEVETALAEVKVHQWAHPRPLRSKHPRGVVQEVYGLLLAHLAVRTLMYQAARQDRVDPDRLSFTGALRVLRRAVPRAQRTAPKRLPLFGAGCSATWPPSASRPAAPAPTRAPSSAR
jgi:Insertion element 4 transposase N-terminal/Transposase DDE domain